MGMIVNSYRYATASGPTMPELTAVGTASTGTNVSSFTPSFPAVQANDILLLYVYFYGGTVTITTPAGWTAIDSTNYANLPNSPTAGLFWKRATGSESGTETVNLSGSIGASSPGVAFISGWRGCVTSGSPYERNAFFGTIGTTTACQGKGLTTAGANRRVVSFFGHPAVATTGTNSNGWTEDYEANTTSGNDASWAMCSLAQAVAGKVSPCKRTLGSAASHVAHTIALVPTVGTPGSADPFSDILVQSQFTGSNGSTTFTDQSHYEHVLTAAGNAQIQSNKLDLDGTGDWIAGSASPRQLFRFMNDTLTASDDFTIEVFGAVVDTLATTQTLASMWESSATANRGWFLFVATTGNVTFQYATVGNTTITLINYAAGITTGVAHDYRVVRSISAGEVYLYIDGTKVATATLSAATNIFASTAPLVIGANNIAGTPGPMNGQLAAVRITRDALSTGASYSVPSLPLATS